MAELVPYLRGWRGYFGFCQTPEVLVGLIRWVVCAFALLFGDNGKLHAVAGQHCWHWGCVREKRMIPLAAVLALVSCAS
jgi:hypothetical protein